MAPAATIRLKACKQCGSDYEWRRGALPAPRGCCSPTCYNAWQNERGRARRKAGYYPPCTPQPHRPKTCGHCGEITTRPKFCSARCTSVARDVRLGIRHASRPASCAECAKLFETTDERNRYCSRPCWRKRSNRVSSAIRRSRIARDGSAIRLDPITICERDGWICHLCGRPTPKELRGTTDLRAPEMDHVVPLAQGGEHNEANVACACRGCNLAKRDETGWKPQEADHGRSRRQAEAGPPAFGGRHA